MADIEKQKMKKDEVRTINCEECGVMYELKCLTSQEPHTDVNKWEGVKVIAHCYCPFCGLILA